MTHESPLARELAELVTEGVDPAMRDLDALGTRAILERIHAADRTVADAVGAELDRIAEAVELIVAGFRAGGRLFYVGAGTSGRLGVLDASECPPTFGTPPERVQAVIAGGPEAVFRSQEGAEDDRNAGGHDLAMRGVRPPDVVCGLAASRRTPYVAGALEWARNAGCRTILVSANPPRTGTRLAADVTISAVVGPEIVMGSTRMKAGTAQKMVLNMLSTAAMVRMGKVYGNLMVDLRAGSAKLIERARRIVRLATGCTYEDATAALEAANGSVKAAIVMRRTGASRAQAEARLEASGGFVRGALAATGVDPELPRGSMEPDARTSLLFPPPAELPLPARGEGAGGGVLFPRRMRLAELAAKPTRRVAGLMSGTSLDGIDVALVDLTGSGSETSLSLLAARTYPYAPNERERLAALMDASSKLGGGDSTDAAPRRAQEGAEGEGPLPGGGAGGWGFWLERIAEANFWLGDRFGEAVLRLCEETGTSAATVDLVGSHGLTIYHRPPCGDRPGATWQIGEAAAIRERVGSVVVSDFRVADVAAGGHGAPLAPYVDHLLLGREGTPRAAHNLGGISNVTVVTGALENIVAFDTGPCNLLMDGMTRLVTDGALAYDEGGALAATGEPDLDAAAAFLKHPYLMKRPPKSTGREMFDLKFVKDLAARLEGSIEDKIATATRAVADSILQAYRDFVLPRFPLKEAVFSGGGAHNATLMQWLAKGLTPVPVRTSDAYGIPVDAKEAILFAILADKTISGRAANVPSATGAQRPVVLGKICF